MKSLNSLIEETKFQDIKQPKYQGTDHMMDDIKDVVDDKLAGNVQMLDACQTYVNRAMSALSIATSEMSDNYTDDQISKINRIYNSLKKEFDNLDKMIQPLS